MSNQQQVELGRELVEKHGGIIAAMRATRFGPNALCVEAFRRRVIETEGAA